MKNTIYLLPVFILMMASCSKNTQVSVTYQTTKAISEYQLSYVDESGTLLQKTIQPQSAQDKWIYTFQGEQGDIVYISGKYADANSALSILIKVDGKIYKQASNEGDTLKYLTVSGVVPID